MSEGKQLPMPDSLQMTSVSSTMTVLFAAETIATRPPVGETAMSTGRAMVGMAEVAGGSWSVSSAPAGSMRLIALWTMAPVQPALE
jgi:hypothetical protein